MQFEYTSPQTEFERMIGGFFCVNAFGPIEVGDDVRFVDFLEGASPPPRTTIYINSSGGDVDVAMSMGRTIRDGWFETSVGTYTLSPTEEGSPIVRRTLLPGKCMSAATLMFLGGRLRHHPQDAEFGVHQFSFKNPTPEHIGRSQILSAKIARYVVDMGVKPEFLELSSAIPSKEIHKLELSMLKDIGAVTGGQTDVSWSIQAIEGTIYVRGERDSIFGHHKVLLGYGKGSGFYFTAVIEALGREWELTSFPLVEIVVNGEDIRIDISNRASRTVNGIYVITMVELSETEARILAHSDSFGIQVRGSAEAELFLGVAAVDTSAGKQMLTTLFDMFSGPATGRQKA